MLDFIYDKALRDQENELRVSVTVVDADGTGVQINLESGTLRIPFFLTLPNARLLAKYLQQACDAHDAAIREAAAS